MRSRRNGEPWTLSADGVLPALLAPVPDLGENASNDPLWSAKTKTVVDSLNHFSYVAPRARLPAALLYASFIRYQRARRRPCRVQFCVIPRRRRKAGSVGVSENGWRKCRNSKRLKIQWLRRCLRVCRNSSKFTPTSGRAKEREMSFLSRFRRQRWAAARTGRGRWINRFRKFPTESHERDPVCRV